MPDSREFSQGARYLIVAAALVVVVAGLRATQEILIPTILAAFLAIVVGPLFEKLRLRGIPTFVSLTVMIGAFALLIVGSAAIIGPSLSGFLDAVPEYLRELELYKLRCVDRIRDLGLDLSEEAELPLFDVGLAGQLISRLVGGIYGLSTNLFLVLLILVFMVLEASGLSAKICDISDDPQQSLAKLEGVLNDIRSYLSLKTMISLATGLLVAVWLKWLGVDYPLLWGLLAFALNFIPNVGSVIAAIPAISVALIRLDVAGAVYVALGYLVINVVIGQIVEPRLLGRKLGLSVLVVFLSLLFWGWLWGPVGMLLSVPLTMVVKIALESAPETRWIGVLMGSDPPVVASDASGEQA